MDLLQDLKMFHKTLVLLKNHLNYLKDSIFEWLRSI